jgi:hypothetical protein
MLSKGLDRHLELGGMRMLRNSSYRRLATAFLGLLNGASMAAQGEMGTGVPANVGLYSNATGMSAIIWSMTDLSTPLPAGCTLLTLSPATMGMDAYKVAISAVMLAKATGKRVRFYAHAPRDSGCGVDYVEVQ